MDGASDMKDLVRTMLHDAEAAWSIGVPGVIAEFHRVEGDPPAEVSETESGGLVRTARGCVAVAMTPDVRAVACEGLSTRPGSWTQTISFCIPEHSAGMGRREVLTELGPDTRAMRPQDRDDVLFDLGVAAPHLDFCIRTRDPALLRLLWAAEGEAILSERNRHLEAIKQASPPRICMSRLGRIEVYQEVASRRRGVPTPAGPHTHVLPAMLRQRRTRPPDAPIPAGWVSALDLYPAHPLTERAGSGARFDLSRHRAFQRLLERYGPPGYMEEKVLVTSAVVAGLAPERYPLRPEPAAQMAARVTLRQMLHTHPELDAVRRWLAVMDTPAGHH